MAWGGSVGSALFARVDFQFVALSLKKFFLDEELPILRSSRADLRLGNVVIFRDLLNRLLVRHRLSGDAGFEFSIQAPSFSLTHLVSFQGCRPLKDPLNSSTSF